MRPGRLSPTDTRLAAAAAMRAVPSLQAHLLGWMNPTGLEKAESAALCSVLRELETQP